MKKLIVFIVILCAFLLFTNCTSQTTTTQPSQTIATTTSQETAVTTEPNSLNTTTPPDEQTTTSTEPTTQPDIEVNVHFIDVGQGDAILVDYDEIEVLIDGGDRSPGVIVYLSDYVDGAIEVMVSVFELDCSDFWVTKNTFFQGIKLIRI